MECLHFNNELVELHYPNEVSDETIAELTCLDCGVEYTS